MRLVGKGLDCFSLLEKPFEIVDNVIDRNVQ